MKKGWEIRKLGEVSEFEGGSQPPKSEFIFEPREGYVRFLQIRDFGSDKNLTFIKRSKKNRYCVEEDILIGRYGASVGKILSNKSGAYNVALMKTIPNTQIINRNFFYLYLISDEFQSRLLKVASRSAQDGFSKEDIFDFEIPVPPLAEQTRLVAKLETAFAAIEQAKQAAAENLRGARGIFEGFLQGVFEGGGEGWEKTTIESVCNVINGFAFPSGAFNNSNPIRSIKITNVGVGEFVEETDEFLPNEYAQNLKNVQVSEGDIVIALTRTIISSGLKVAIVPASFNGALVNQRVAALNPKRDKILKKFLFAYLSTNHVMKYVKDHVNTLMQPNLSIVDLKRMPIPLPKLSEQTTLVATLDRLRAETQKLETLYQSKLSALDELKKSILEKAFAGEL